jgi:hypothetical protein
MNQPLLKQFYIAEGETLPQDGGEVSDGGRTPMMRSSAANQG